jgi:hypothetical protein
MRGHCHRGFRQILVVGWWHHRWARLPKIDVFGLIEEPVRQYPSRCTDHERAEGSRAHAYGYACDQGDPVSPLHCRLLP